MNKIIEKEIKDSINKGVALQKHPKIVEELNLLWTGLSNIDQHTKELDEDQIQTSKDLLRLRTEFEFLKCQLIEEGLIPK